MAKRLLQRPGGQSLPKLRQTRLRIAGVPALLSALLPARRAATIEPMKALRTE